MTCEVIKKKQIVLTVDLEEWFHLLNNDQTLDPKNWDAFESRLVENIQRLSKILELNSAKATFFVLGWIAERYPDVVKSIADLGHSIGSHSYSHQLVFNQDSYDFERDLLQSLEAISKACNKAVESYRAPGFSITKDCTWAFEILAKNGIRLDSSIFPARRSHGGFAEAPLSGPGIIRTRYGDIRELPLNAVSLFQMPFVFSGGGYFRLMPWSVLRRLFDSQSYIMTYFHPRDFDQHQPRLNLSFFNSFKSYYGINRSLRKFELLLENYDFVTCENFDWTNSNLAENVWEI